MKTVPIFEKTFIKIKVYLKKYNKSTSKARDKLKINYLSSPSDIDRHSESSKDLSRDNLGSDNIKRQTSYLLDAREDEESTSHNHLRFSVTTPCSSGHLG